MSEEEYEVERIVDHRLAIVNGTLINEYLIKWKGYSDNENTWQAEDTLNASVLLRQFWNRRKRKQSKNKNSKTKQNSTSKSASTSSNKKNTSPEIKKEISVDMHMPEDNTFTTTNNIKTVNKDITNNDINNNTNNNIQNNNNNNSNTSNNSDSASSDITDNETTNDNTANNDNDNGNIYNNNSNSNDSSNDNNSNNNESDNEDIYIDIITIDNNTNDNVNNIVDDDDYDNNKINDSDDNNNSNSKIKRLIPHVIRASSTSSSDFNDNGHNKENSNIHQLFETRHNKKRKLKDMTKYFESITKVSLNPEYGMVDLNDKDTNTVEENVDFILDHYHSKLNTESLPSSKIKNDVIIENNFRSIWNWDNNVKKIEDVIYKNTNNSKGGLLFYYVKWYDGVLSVHESNEVSNRCPQKVVEFYEERLLKEITKHDK